METTLPKNYDPVLVEDEINKKWDEAKIFVSSVEGVDPELNKREVFSMVLPPPNVTGVLHIGHAYEDSLQDVLIRYQRMCGKKIIWIPGTDSAAIATQARVEKDIQKEEHKNRYDLGREELVRRITEFALKSEKVILTQVKRMGASLDWSRYAYALDEKRQFAVYTAFKRMYEAGLIYRGNRIVNWDPKGQTTISDDEIIYEDRQTQLYTFKYSKDFPIAISTTRPETKVGDTAVAVHPDDIRYKKYIGQEFDLIFCDIPIHIKIVADESVEKDFGTGALGVTPAHSQVDWEIADRHNLPRPQIINEYAKMTVGHLDGKKVSEAREVVVSWLKDQGLLEKEDKIQQNVSISERTGAIIELLPKLQWWVDINKKFTIPYSEIPGIKSGSQVSLNEIMRESVSSGAVKISQERFQKIYFHWIDNLKDWCISRQIWFGHRIPIWYRGDEVCCDIKIPKGEGWVQDPDTLDTWFSSGLWTFSTLGWPEKSQDLKNFHPTSLISPAYEILQLWISRMILMSGFHLGQVPFREVMIHGIVRDKNGRKFSKSLGNGIDPVEMIEKYGADALRMGLMSGAAFGNDVKFDEDQVKGMKHFANKLWNIFRFIVANCDKNILQSVQQPVALTPEDKLILQDLDDTIKKVTGDIKNFSLNNASQTIYQFIWHNLADKYIEASKTQLKDSALAKNTQLILVHCLKQSLKLLHPFMPFITEYIWGLLGSKTFLAIEKWPTSKS